MMYQGKSVSDWLSTSKTIMLSSSSSGLNRWGIFGSRPKRLRSFMWFSYIRRYSKPRCLTTRLKRLHKYFILSFLYSVVIWEKLLPRALKQHLVMPFFSPIALCVSTNCSPSSWFPSLATVKERKRSFGLLAASCSLSQALIWSTFRLMAAIPGSDVWMYSSFLLRAFKILALRSSSYCESSLFLSLFLFRKLSSSLS